MANFLDATSEIDARLRDYDARLRTIEAHIRRGERRAALARLDGFLDELLQFVREVELPWETVIVGAQLGFFSGGEVLRGRIPSAFLGAAAGWLYGQQMVLSRRVALERLAQRVADVMMSLESPEPTAESGS